MDEDDHESAQTEEDEEKKARDKRKKLWEKLRSHTRQIIEKTSYGKSKYWSPAIGK